MDYQKKTVLLKDSRFCLLRRPGETDAARLSRFQRESAAETPYLVVGPEDITLTPEEQAARIKAWNTNSRRLRLIAEVDGELAGAALLYGSGFQPRLRHRCSVDITLYRKFWSLGIGTALLEEILTAAKSAGFEQAELEVVSTNAPAIGLYQKLGFASIGTMPHALKYKDGSYADFFLMVKRL